jgi:predicted transcriptional regulator
LLEHLSIKGSEGDKYINLVSFYNEFVKRSSSSSVQMADYLKFLKDTGFIEFVGEGSELSVKIFPYGVDFLSYIKQIYALTYKYRPW